MAAMIKRSCLFFPLASMALALVLVSEVTMVHGQQLTPGQCKTEVRLGANACRPVAFGQPASPACCQRVRVSHFECVCPEISPKLASILNINQVIKLLQGCGRKAPRHFKCGSLYFP